MVVDDSVPKHAKEPGNRALLVADLVATLESLDESSLKDIFSRFSACYAEQKELQELVDW